MLLNCTEVYVLPSQTYFVGVAFRISAQFSTRGLGPELRNSFSAVAHPESKRVLARSIALTGSFITLSGTVRSSGEFLTVGSVLPVVR